MTQHGHEARALADFVVSRRCDLGMTQAEFAVKAGVGERTVQNIEYGKRPQPLTLAAVARAFGMTSAELREAAAAGLKRPAAAEATEAEAQAS
jgi:transcriptional regulator with XRE-family HTH domain